MDLPHVNHKLIAISISTISKARNDSLVRQSESRLESGQINRNLNRNPNKSIQIPIGTWTINTSRGHGTWNESKKLVVSCRSE